MAKVDPFNGSITGPIITREDEGPTRELHRTSTFALLLI